MTVSKNGKRIGRPPQNWDAPKRAGVGFRISFDARKKLEEAAKKNCRSLSQELEFRLEQSFRDEWILEQIRSAVSMRSGNG